MDEYQVVEIEDDAQVKVDLRDLFRCILRNLVPIIIVAVIFGALGLAAAQLRRSTLYTAEMTMIVNSPNGIDQPGTPAKTQASSVQAVLNNEKIMTPVYNNSTRKDRKHLIDDATVTADDEDTSGGYTHVFTLSLTGTNRKSAKQGARELTRGAEKVLTENLNTVASVKISSAKISKTITPSRKKYGVAAAAAGFVLALLYVLFKFLNDSTYRSETLLEEDTKWPVLGTIPAAASAEKLSPKGGRHA